MINLRELNKNPEAFAGELSNFIMALRFYKVAAYI
jgi:hypothetical protein